MSANRKVSMLVLIFVVCSVLEGQSCRQLSPVPLEENAHMTGCLIASQIEGAKWIEAHPNYYIQRAICKPVDRSRRA
jgi:hypothetical protein